MIKEIINSQGYYRRKSKSLGFELIVLKNTRVRCFAATGIRPRAKKCTPSRSDSKVGTVLSRMRRQRTNFLLRLIRELWYRNASDILASRRDLNPTDNWAVIGRGKMSSEATWLKDDSIPVGAGVQKNTHLTILAS